MMFVYAAILIAVLVLVFLIVRWWNLPATIEQRRLAAEEAAKRQAERRERWDNRDTIFHRRPKPVTPPAPVEPVNPAPMVPEPEKPVRRWFRWIKREPK